MEIQEKKILDKCTELFMRFGVRSITMDDIARELGMSKKTLYQYAENKEDLIFKTLENHFAEEKILCKQLMNEHENAIEEMLQLGKHLIEEMQDTNHAILFDLKKYYPEAFALVENYRHSFIADMMLNNIKRGIKQGLYRKDFKPELITRFYIAKFDIFFSPNYNAMKDFTMSEIHRESIIYHIRGIASDKGLEYLHENLKKIK